jgi:hypothetical protein
MCIPVALLKVGQLPGFVIYTTTIGRCLLKIFEVFVLFSSFLLLRRVQTLPRFGPHCLSACGWAWAMTRVLLLHAKCWRICLQTSPICDFACASWELRSLSHVKWSKLCSYYSNKRSTHLRDARSVERPCFPSSKLWRYNPSVLGGPSLWSFRIAFGC